MPSSVLIALSVSLAILCYKLVNLIRYVRQARTTGLPYVITPVLETEVIGLIATPILRKAYNDYLNKDQGWPRWCRFMVKDWSWEDKRRAHDEYGDVFLCVSPEGIICYTADAAMGWDVMNRRNDFTKPRDKYKILEPYGPNVATAEGATYRFHVRVTAPPFGDGSGVNELVWSETLHQTRQLSRNWAENQKRDLEMDVNALTLAVISRAGFGKPLSLDHGIQEKEDVPSGYKVSFLRAIHDTTAHMVSILMLPGWLLNLTPLRQAHVAHSQLDRYLRAMIRTERKELQQNEHHQSSVARGNLLTAVLRASFLEGRAANGTETAAAGSRKEAFNEDEVLGNLFIYLLAGYETTANAISYGLACLALHQDIQDKVIEELDAVYASMEQSGSVELSYGVHFELLRYMYGFMYEVLRLYPGVTLITKVALRPQTVSVTVPSSSTGTAATTTTAHVLPAGTRVYMSAPGVHYHPRYWKDPTRLDPHRWMDSIWSHNKHDGEESAKRRILAADKTRHMRGTLLTFSDGARACLGRKFAQAEFMGFFAALLRDYRIALAPEVDPIEVKRDLDRKSAGKITLAPLNSVKLKLEKRQVG